MIINKALNKYIISDSFSIQEALNQINSNKHRIVYIVDDQNFLRGSLTDGDVRRWLLNGELIDLSKAAIEIANVACLSMAYSANSKDIEAQLSDRILSIPLVDADGRLVAVAEPRPSFFEIDARRISNNDPCFIIAEVGNNHQGDVKLAKKLVDLAVDSGVDCVKFQMRNMKQLYRNEGVASDASADLGAQYTLDLLAKFQLADHELFEVFDYCKSKGVIALCTPWDLGSLRKLEAYGMPAYKVASADFTNFELLEALAKTGKTLLCSTGMSAESEIQTSVSFLRKKNAKFILLHCNSTYPTPYKDVNLNYLDHLAESTGSLVGYSGHERGWSVPIAAVAMGAKVIEKHFTVDRGLEGNDHKVSLLPEEFEQMVKQIREVEESLGNAEPRVVTQGEMMNREVLAKSLVINQDLDSGQTIQHEMVSIKSPGQGLQPNRLHELVGKKAVRALKAGDFFYESDITGKFWKKNQYTFRRPYGIPVRYHDFKGLTKDVELDFVEFHLSYRDLEVELDEYLYNDSKLGFAVHAPELFSGDHLLDLSASDSSYRERSISELQRVIDHTNSLKSFFPEVKKPVLVVNAGGWSTNGFIKKSEKIQRYARIRAAFEELNYDGVDIAIQTMPPFPWHFGGQSYHNLFIDPSEIVTFCKQTGLKICLDVSHSMMACNYYGWDLYEFTKTVGPYTVHMHIVDATGVDAEGVQIGQGDVDFGRLGSQLDEVAPGVQFIPEIWQGHKNMGQGFWEALAYLERYL